jgi:phage terminase small subunit
MLTDRQALFVREYLRDLNATQAAIRAGYSPKIAAEQGYANLRKHQIAEAISKAQQTIQDKFVVSVDEIARELYKLGFANMQDYMTVGADGDPVLDWSRLTRDQAAALQDVTVEDYRDGRGKAARDVRKVRFRLADKRASLVDLAKVLGLVTDNIHLKGELALSAKQAEEEARALSDEELAKVVELGRQVKAIMQRKAKGA